MGPWRYEGPFDTANPPDDRLVVPYLSLLTGSGARPVPYVYDTALRRSVLSAMVMDVAFVGSERLRRADVTHYRALADGSSLSKKLPPDLAAQAAEFGANQIHGDLDVWVDQPGRLRKVVVESRKPSDMVILQPSVELWDYDAPVTIEVPPYLPPGPGSSTPTASR
jgi:hypothetical protein